MHVAVTAPSAFEDHVAAKVSGHIRDDLSGICLPDDSAFRHLDLYIPALFTGHSFFLAVFSVLCGILADMAEVGEGVETLIHYKNDVAALAAVSSVRAACGDILFPAERDMTVAALAAGNNNSGFIYKHELHSCRYLRSRPPQRPGLPGLRRSCIKIYLSCQYLEFYYNRQSAGRCIQARRCFFCRYTESSGRKQPFSARSSHCFENQFGTKALPCGNYFMLPAPQPQLPLQDVRKLSCGTCRSARNEGCRL